MTDGFVVASGRRVEDDATVQHAIHNRLFIDEPRADFDRLEV
jgi:hypothetical protein